MLRGIIVRIVVFAGLPLAFFRPFWGVLFYLWYSHGRPNDFVWPEYAFESGALLIAVVTLAGYVIFEIHNSPPRLQGLVLLVMFWFWIALATLFAADRALALIKLGQYTNIFIITFLVSAVANSESRIRAMMNVLAVSVGLLGAKAGFDFLITGGQFRARGSGGLMQEENEFALALNMAIPILFGLAKLESRRWVRYAYQIMGAGCMITVVATYSRSGFLGLALASLLLAWYSNRRILALIALSLASVLFLVLAPSKALERYGTIPTATQVDPSVIGRLEAWQTGLNMMKAHPLVGVGPLNFFTTFSHYSNFKPRAPHNAFVALGAESGIPSCLLFSAFVTSAIFRMWKLRRKLSDDPDFATLSAYCLIIQMTLMVYIIPNFFISRQNEDLMYHLVGISVGLAAVVRQRMAVQEVEQRQEFPEYVVDEPVLA